MIIKNTDTKDVVIQMNTRQLTVKPGQERFISAEEVRDPTLREQLQVRAISIVRPATDAENKAREKLDQEEVED